jgi:SAM-dependent methyltransferase
MSENPIGYAVQDLYRTAALTRSNFGGDLDGAMNYYADLVEFVSRISPSNTKNKLLDVGCGCGWSSFCFTRAGYLTTGVDLNADEFEPPELENLTLREGSALALPFADSSFDVVTSYQCLEHIPDPEVALREMIRVCRPDGVIAIVGPNLVTPLLPLKFLFRELMNRGFLYKRDAQTPKHPYGNTAGENLSKFFSTALLLLQKLSGPKIRFDIRVPDSIPPFHGDNDACYLCNPIDLIRFFRNNHLHVIQKGRHGRPPLSYLFAGGTWVAAKKNELVHASHAV